MGIKEKAYQLKEELYVFRQMHFHKAFHKSEKNKDEKHFMHKDMMFLHWLMKQEEPVKMNEIADFFHVTAAAVSQQMKEYEKKGWIERYTLENDRRSVYLKVSEKAETKLKACENEMNQNVIQFLEYLGEEDCDALLRILEKVRLYKKKGNEYEETR